MSVPGPTVIEFFHSKLFSPTRRLCLGEVRLPADAGCLLVSRIAARFGAAVDRATAEEVRDLWAVLCRRSRADQPRGRYRLQTVPLSGTPEGNRHRRAVGPPRGKADGSARTVSNGRIR